MATLDWAGNRREKNLCLDITKNLTKTIPSFIYMPSKFNFDFVQLQFCNETLIQLLIARISAHTYQNLPINFGLRNIY